MSFPEKDRKSRPDSRKGFPADAGGRIGGGRFATAIAAALRREFGGHRSAIKSVAALTGANERTVKNWFEAKNGPNGEALVSLVRHSDEVLECLLLLANRDKLVDAQKLGAMRQTLSEMMMLLDKISGRPATEG